MVQNLNRFFLQGYTSSEQPICGWGQPLRHRRLHQGSVTCGSTCQVASMPDFLSQLQFTCAFRKDSETCSFMSMPL